MAASQSGDSLQIPSQSALHVDPSGILQLTCEFPRQCSHALELSQDFLPPPGSFSRVLLLGMGGSAIGGDLVRALMDSAGSAPVTVCRDCHSPSWAGPDTLCIAVSYSGNTEETISAAREARERGAAIAGISSGGALTEWCAANNDPCVKIPAGQPPRTALGYLLVPALIMLFRAGLGPDPSEPIREAVSEMESVVACCGPGTGAADNPALKLAGLLRQQCPVIYGSNPAFGVAALRWKCQFNENAKMHALSDSLPEFNHNQICAWRSAQSQGSFSWIFLRDPLESSTRRLDATKAILRGESTGCIDVVGTGKSLLSRLLTAILTGDFVTVYCALLNGLDPSDISEIDRLKEALQDHGTS